MQRKGLSSRASWSWTQVTGIKKEEEGEKEGEGEKGGEEGEEEKRNKALSHDGIDQKGNGHSEEQRSEHFKQWHHKSTGIQQKRIV